uniref:ATP synthase complex subunit 8 n=1 Tax=Kryptolebias hermaphroditus TaxID=1747188 RepID=A0A343AMV8_9TELE|nr:ATP synthase F0 subunit 8 [Kryptolebias hermaphroditus]API83171.1 ATP synthase F0 subunit 8 [Kryptolebias hermaphroditus]
MPQLNPAPWFLILVFSWLVFLALMPPKILIHQFPYEPSTLTAHKPKANSWTWAWQ